MTRLLRFSIDEMFGLMLVLVVLELGLAGSGRMIEIGPLTLRMVLFVTCVLMTLLVSVARFRVNRAHGLLLFAFVGLISLSSTVGIWNDAQLGLILEDIKPLSYFLMLPFFYLAINSPERVRLIVYILKYSALILLFSYLSILALLKLGRIDFLTFYIWSNSTGEFFFRGLEGFFFYKGFLFMCVGFFFFWIDGGKWGKLIALGLLGGIVLTFTRGFILAVGISFVLYLLSRSWRNAALLLVIGGFIPLLVWGFSIASGVRSDLDTSTQFRLTIVNEVLDRVTLWSLWVGNGFGVGIPSREVHMEISYLEIFHKQGLLGLLFWGALLLLLCYRYVRCLHTPEQRLASAFFWSCMFVVFQSFTNPFINNSIGMSVILIALVSLRILARSQSLSATQTDRQAQSSTGVQHDLTSGSLSSL